MPSVRPTDVCALAASAFVVACGGHEATTAPDAGPEGAITDSATDTSIDAPPAPTGCVSSSGYAVCGGTHDCFPASSLPSMYCRACQSFGSDAAVLCTNSVLPNGPMPGLATDGQVYVDGLGDGIWDPVPFDVGELFSGDGLADRVRYADWSSWTGTQLPTPANCPKFTSFSICGGNCGPCSAGGECTGRSPAHEYGVCLDNYANLAGCDASQGWSCPSSQSCMVFRVGNADQPYADRAGVCLSDSVCQAIAANYPGGAYCHGAGG